MAEVRLFRVQVLYPDAVVWTTMPVLAAGPMDAMLIANARGCIVGKAFEVDTLAETVDESMPELAILTFNRNFHIDDPYADDMIHAITEEKPSWYDFIRYLNPIEWILLISLLLIFWYGASKLFSALISWL